MPRRVDPGDNGGHGGSDGFGVVGRPQAGLGVDGIPSGGPIDCMEVSTHLPAAYPAAAGPGDDTSCWKVHVKIWVFSDGWTHGRWFNTRQNPEITLDIPLGAKVAALKELLAKQEGFPAKDQKWLYGWFHVHSRTVVKPEMELDDQEVVGPHDGDGHDQRKWPLHRPWFRDPGARKGWEWSRRVVNVLLPSYFLDPSWDYKLVLAMGKHPRLGSESSIFSLNTDILILICKTIGAPDIDEPPVGAAADVAAADSVSAADDVAAATAVAASPPPAAPALLISLDTVAIFAGSSTGPHAP